ncbi:MAG: HAMP domain-containing sensor histidine kinase [Acidimicrobiales bacterium]
MKASSNEWRRAAGVAGVATVIGMAAFVLLAVVVNTVLLGRLNSHIDQRLHQQLTVAVRVEKGGGAKARRLEGLGVDDDSDDVPIYLWRVDHDGVAHAFSSGSPGLKQQGWTTGLRTETVGQSLFRLRATPYRSGWLVSGQSLAEVSRLSSSLFDAEVAGGAVLAVLMFLAASVVGLRALAPLALARRRQAEFTSDASHELRTPLSVIEAEVELALSRPRDAAAYQSALHRVGDEGRRLRRIVEDLLWLARSDEVVPAPDAGETCDLADVAAAAATRFEGLARSSDVSLEFVGPGVPAPVRATHESIDRLVGVLVDNACKFAGHRGRVVVAVRALPHRLVLTVEDSGPGIPVEDRHAIFDRFHRTDSSGGGTGLGLAIASAIISSTHAQCVVGESPLGGARFEVTWRRSS